MCPVTLPLVFPLKYLALHTTTALRPSVSNYIGLVHLNKLQTWVSPSVKLYWPPLSQQPPSTSTINVRPCLPIWQVEVHCSLDRYKETILICTNWQQLTSPISVGCILFRVVVVGWTSLLRVSWSVLSMLYPNAACTSFNCRHQFQQGAWESVCWSRVPEHVKLCRKPFRFQIRSLTIDNPEHENPARCFAKGTRFYPLQRQWDPFFPLSVKNQWCNEHGTVCNLSYVLSLSEIEIRSSPNGAKSIWADQFTDRKKDRKIEVPDFSYV